MADTAKKPGRKPAAKPATHTETHAETVVTRPARTAPSGGAQNIVYAGLAALVAIVAIVSFTNGGGRGGSVSDEQLATAIQQGIDNYIAAQQQQQTQAQEQQAQQARELAKNVPGVTDADHMRGPRDAEIVLVEYSDYQCPFCQRFHGEIKKAQEANSSDVAWVLRHFPLDQIHPLARPAALVAECVAEEAGADAFWAFSDAAFAALPADAAGLVDMAVANGATRATVQSCLDTKKHENVVTTDVQGGLASGVNSTPTTFVVNTKTGRVEPLIGAFPQADIQAVIDEMKKENAAQ